MIDRYLIKELSEIFSDESRFNAYLEIEIASLEGFSLQNKIPKDSLEKIKQKAKVNVSRIKEIEKETKHDVVAFTRQISETLGDEKKYVHYGLTSTDVVDTAMGLLYKKANDIIEKDLEILISSIKEKAIKYKMTPCIGRTHGMHSEITSFGLKFALFYDELIRNFNKFKEGRKEIESGKISGAVGNFCNVDPEIQDYVCNKFNLTSSKISTQVLSRDLHCYYCMILTLISSTLEKIALNIRLLSQSEIQEVEEGFSVNQKGSSAMPQKRNPISSENICGCARMMRGYLFPIIEDNALFHERDISHSSVERVSLISMIELFDYMVRRLNGIIVNLRVFENNMIRNINLTGGAIFSQHLLSLLIEKGMIREEAYDLIQPLAMKCALKELSNFKDEVMKVEKVMKVLSKEEVDSVFDFGFYLRNVDKIYKRVGIE